MGLLEAVEVFEYALLLRGPLHGSETLQSFQELARVSLRGLFTGGNCQDDDFRGPGREVPWQTNLYLVVFRDSHLHLMSLHVATSFYPGTFYRKTRTAGSLAATVRSSLEALEGSL
jgi:hypothetical protein